MIPSAELTHVVMETPIQSNLEKDTPAASSVRREAWVAPTIIPLDLGSANTTQFTALHDHDLGPKPSS